MSNLTLQDKVFVITGAKGGLGTYVTNAFLDAGAQVAGVSRSIQASDSEAFRRSRIRAVVDVMQQRQHLAQPRLICLDEQVGHCPST